MPRIYSVFCTGSAKVRLFLLSTPDFNRWSKLYLKRKFYFHTRKKNVYFFPWIAGYKKESCELFKVHDSKCKYLQISFFVLAVWVWKWWSVTYMCSLFFFFAVWLKFAFILIQNMYRLPLKKLFRAVTLGKNLRRILFKQKYLLFCFHSQNWSVYSEENCVAFNYKFDLEIFITQGDWKPECSDHLWNLAF